ncbi:MAG: alpha/beta hydrolase [candidate division Zixibacteria bacterium]|nr:alpha/beta hydrolase [candidate division Zixibacteria bacterium]
MVYIPHRDITMLPSDVGLSFDDVRMTTSDGGEINGWFIPAENQNKVLLFCHGNAGNISHRIESLQIFNKLGLSTFIFDYRGYGKSEGKPTEKGTYLDAEAAWNYLINEKQIKPEDIVIFGRSLGGSVASWLAKEKSPSALILESAFTSIPDIAGELYPIFPVRLLSRFQYDTKEYVASARCPVLIIHSRKDELIPYHHGETLFNSANDPKEFLEITGGHNDGFILSGKLYEDGLAGFINRL